LNKPVKATQASVKKYCISINGKTYKPITNTTQNQILLGGKVYVPVNRIETEDIGSC
jgi:hypothetical protein